MADTPIQTATAPDQLDWIRVQEHSWSSDLFGQPITFIELRWAGQDNQNNLLDKENTPPKVNNNSDEHPLRVIDHKKDATVGAINACTPQAL